MKKLESLAIVGATGLVGQTFLEEYSVRAFREFVRAHASIPKLQNWFAASIHGVRFLFEHISNFTSA